MAFSNREVKLKWTVDAETGKVDALNSSINNVEQTTKKSTQALSSTGGQLVINAQAVERLTSALERSAKVGSVWHGVLVGAANGITQSFFTTRGVAASLDAGFKTLAGRISNTSGVASTFGQNLAQNLAGPMQATAQQGGFMAEAFKSMAGSMGLTSSTAVAAGAALAAIGATVAAVLIGITALTAGISGLISLAKGSVEAFQNLEKAMLGLQSASRFVGVGFDEAQKAALNLSSDGLLTVGEAALGLKNLLAAGFGLDEATRLMEGFKDTAAFGRQAALSFGQAVTSATEGIKNQNSVLVDNAGVTKNISVILREAGFEMQDLSDKVKGAEARTALYNGLLKEMEIASGDAAKMTATLSGIQSKMNAEWEQSKAVLGLALMPALIEFAKFMGALVTELKAWLDNNAKAFEVWGQRIATVAQIITVHLKTIRDMMHLATGGQFMDLGIRPPDVTQPSFEGTGLSPTPGMKAPTGFTGFLRDQAMLEAELLAIRKKASDDYLASQMSLQEQLRKVKEEAAHAEIEGNKEKLAKLLEQENKINGQIAEEAKKKAKERMSTEAEIAQAQFALQRKISEENIKMQENEADSFEKAVDRQVELNKTQMRLAFELRVFRAEQAEEGRQFLEKMWAAGREELKKNNDVLLAQAKKAKDEVVKHLSDIANMFHKIAQSIGGLGGGISNIFGNIFGALAENKDKGLKGMDAFKNVLGGVGDALQVLGDTIGGTVGKIVNGIGTLASAFAAGGWVGVIVAGAGMLINALTGLFKHDWGKDVANVGRQFGFGEFSESTSQMLTELAEKVGDAGSAVVLSLGKIRDEIGITMATIPQFINSLQYAFEAVEKGFITTEQAMQSWKDVLPSIVDFALQEIGALTPEILALVETAKKAGIEIPAVAEFTTRAIQSLTGAANNYAELLGKRIDVLQDKMKLAQLTTLSLTQKLTEEQAAQLKSLQDIYGKTAEITDRELNELQNGFAALAAMTVGAFMKMKEEGASIVAIITQLKPAIDQLRQAWKDFGTTGNNAPGSHFGGGEKGLPPGVGQLIAFFNLAEKFKAPLEEIQALSLGLTALNQLGLLNQRTFTDMQRAMLDNFRKIQGGGGASRNELALMKPELVQLAILAERYGFALDPAIQRLINLAKQQGIITEADFAPTMEESLVQLNAWLETLNQTLQTFITSLQGVPPAINVDVNTNYTESGPAPFWTDPDYEWEGKGGLAIPSFAGMTVPHRVVRGGLFNLHPGEGITPSGSTMGGGGDVTVIIQAGAFQFNGSRMSPEETQRTIETAMKRITRPGGAYHGRKGVPSRRQRTA